MKTLKLFLVLCIVVVNYSFSQEFQIGVRGGFNYNSIGDIDARPYPPVTQHVIYSPEKDLGFQLGAYFNYEFGRFFVRPEINYFSFKNHYNFPDRVSKWESSKIEVPILVGVEVIKPFYVYLGPDVSFHGDTTLEGVQVTSYSDGGPDLKKTTFGLNFGVLLKVNRFSLDLRYELGLSESDEELLDIMHSSYGVNLADLEPYKANVISLSLTVDIFRSNNDEYDGLLSNLFRKGNKCACPY